jgi:peptide/nickel transport system permease protein
MLTMMEPKAPTNSVAAVFQSRLWRRLARRRSALLGLVLVVFMVLVAILAPLLAPYDPASQSWTAVRKAPSVLHWMGTDESGRDVLSRIVWGTRASLLAGLTSVCIAMAIGVPLGLAAGFLGGLVDGFISRFTDAMLACPLPRKAAKAIARIRMRWAIRNGASRCGTSCPTFCHSSWFRQR